MLKKLSHFISAHRLLISISFILVVIPFFWFKPGYIDIGGDSSRLYFYDPFNFLRYFATNLFLPDSLGIRSNQTYMIPFITFLTFLHFLLQSPWLVNNVFNSINLVVPFLTVYAITEDFIKSFSGKSLNKKVNTWGAVIAGLFYVFIPISSMGGWDLALIIQTERFVYPLIFLLLLRFLVTSRLIFLLLALLTSFVFAQNFAWVALPNMVSFFFLSFMYLILYAVFIKKVSLPFKKIGIGLVLFVLLQAFQYVPLFVNIFQKNSDVSNQLLQGSVIADTFHYVDSVASYTERGFHFIGVTPFSPLTPLNVMLVVFPIIIVAMLMQNKNWKLLIPMAFFLLLYFLTTAKITKFGFSLFKDMFYLPGFVMFRDFYGRFLELFLLFYSVLVGYAVSVLIISFKSFQRIVFLAFLGVILVLNALPMLIGSIVNRILTQDTGVVVKSHFYPEKDLENVLTYFRNDKNVERNITFPIADFDYELLAGGNKDGVYFGPSMLSYLTGKADLASNFTLRPFALGLFESIKNSDYQTVSNIFPLLGVQTLFYDANPYIYEIFATFPYNDAKLYFPKTEKGLQDIVTKLPLEKKKEFGNDYHLYEVNKNLQLPILYSADKVLPIDSTLRASSNYDENTFKDATYVLQHFRDNSQDEDIRKAFLQKDVHINILTVPQISFSQVNPSKYIVTVKNVTGPYLLVFSESFNANWKLYPANQVIEQKRKMQVIGRYFNNEILEKTYTSGLEDITNVDLFNKNVIADNRHYLVNAYANAWYITPSDMQQKKEYTLVLEMSDKKYVEIGFLVTGIALVVLLGLLSRELYPLIRKNMYKNRL